MIGGKYMGAEEIIKQALKLNPKERFIIVESLIQSIDEPNKVFDDIWVDEAEKRLEAYRNGQLKGISMEDVFRE